MSLLKSNWQRNTFIFKLDSSLYEFYLPIATWIFIWTPHFTFTQMTRALSIGMIISIIMEVPSGAIADLMGRKFAVFLSRLIYFIAYIILFFNHAYSGFLTWMILYQISISFDSGSLSALLFDSLKENNQQEKYEQIEADRIMYTKTSMAIAAILGGFLFTISPFTAYNVMVLTTGINVLLTLLYQEPELESTQFNVQTYLKQNKDGFSHIFSNSKIKIIAILSILLYGISWFGVWYVYEPRLFEAGFSPQVMSWLVAGGYIIHALGTRLTRFNKQLRPNVPIYLAVAQAATTLISVITGKITALVSIYSRKITDGWITPSMLNYQNRHIQSKYRATSLSVISLFANLLVALSGFWIGPALDNIGAAKTMGIIGILSLILVVPISVITVKTIHPQINKSRV